MIVEQTVNVDALTPHPRARVGSDRANPATGEPAVIHTHSKCHMHGRTGVLSDSFREIMEGKANQLGVKIVPLGCL